MDGLIAITLFVIFWIICGFFNVFMLGIHDRFENDTVGKYIITTTAIFPFLIGPIGIPFYISGAILLPFILLYNYLKKKDILFSSLIMRVYDLGKGKKEIAPYERT